MEPEVYNTIKANIKKLLDIDLSYYKDEQMKRRLDSWLVRSGASSWEEYFHRVRTNPDEMTRLRNYLTINVTEFFRDIERWQYLRTTVIPALLKDIPAARGIREGLRIWSAGCSIGVEPYTLAILLDEITAVRNHYILATDLDRGALKKARERGPYTAEETRNITPAQRSTYFDPGGPPYYITQKIANRITFKEQNLLADPFEQNFDLIVCRNVVIYFTQDAKNLLYQKFSQALRPGGILFLGGTEIIPRPQDFGLKNFGISFYTRAQP
ncbi:MAG TPA: protein-glutamate O-methyltransferase CheR [Anaerolineaceae bacterium]